MRQGQEWTKECHQSIRGNRQPAERGQMGQMAEIKTVQRVGVAGGGGLRRAGTQLGGRMLEAQANLCLKQDYQGSPRD